MENPLGQHLRKLPGPLMITGHTGFKGTWMSLLLEHLNVPVVGYSLEAEKDSLFERAARVAAIPEVFADIRDYETLEKFINQHRPSTIIHMAAQPLVLKSYEYPRETFDVNVMGTVNVLDIAFKKDYVKAVIVVTTDKVYRNDNSGRAFIESDPLEGKDPYSASKVGTEAVVSAWQQIAKISGGPNVISVRSGNVIGGGDYSRDRLLPDLVKGYAENEQVLIRNPQGKRPWLHVLDTSVGYLRALEKVIVGEIVTSINFAPKGNVLTVEEIVNLVRKAWPTLQVEFESFNQELRSGNAVEAQTLLLNANLANNFLNWESKLSQSEAVTLTLDWWQTYLNTKKTEGIMESQIRDFLK